MQGIGRWALDGGVDLFWAATNDADLGAALEPSLVFKKRFRFAYFSRDAACFDELARHPLSLQAIDSDTDTMYG